MSYDVYAVIPTGAPEMADVGYAGNYTYNVHRMFRLALGCGLSDLNGLMCKEVVERVRHGVRDMEARPDDYRAMNPANGWGDYEGALRYLGKILALCEEHPLAFLAVR